MNETLTEELAKHVSRMYRVALRFVGRVEDAQEVTQNACVKALRAAASFDGRAALATWLHRITVNCAHDHLRRCRRCDQLHADADSAGLLAMLEAGPAERAEQAETYRLAMGHVAELPDECRSAFILTQLDGYSYDEVAQIENAARGTIASRVHRARQILMDRMSQHLAGERT